METSTEDEDEDKNEDEEMHHTFSESYCPPAVLALEVMDREIRRAVVTIRAVKAHRLGDR